jgi:hypothetical protein
VDETAAFVVMVEETATRRKAVSDAGAGGLKPKAETEPMGEKELDCNMRPLRDLKTRKKGRLLKGFLYVITLR